MNGRTLHVLLVAGVASLGGVIGGSAEPTNGLNGVGPTEPRHAKERSLVASESAGPWDGVSLDFRALTQSTVGARSNTHVVPIATDVALAIDGDFDLGGFIFKDGVPFIHNDGGQAYENTALGINALVSATPGSPYSFDGERNTALGYRALQYNTEGRLNTGLGVDTLRYNTTGDRNTALGDAALISNQTGGDNVGLGLSALASNTYGFKNVAVGNGALVFNVGGPRNTAIGYRALLYNLSGSNTAVGSYALVNNTYGSRNTAVGYKAGENWTTGDHNIAIGSGSEGYSGETATIRIGGYGYQFRTFIEGIRGATTYYDDAVPVLIDSANQLGTVSSSARVKEDVQDLADRSEPLVDLRPVAFRYKKPFRGGSRPIQFGLLAEEVAEVFPELVVYDRDGQPETVKYHLLPTLLLNELQKEKSRSRELHAEVDGLNDRLEEQARLLVELRRTVADLEARTVSRRE